MDQSVRIMRARVRDRQGISRAHKASIGVLCAGHYTPQEIESWIGGRQPDDYLPGIQENIVLIAVAQDRVAGFAEMQGHDGLISTAGQEVLRLDATLNSVSFYLSRGYTLQGEGMITTRGGLTIPCVHMQKRLESAKG
jgi:hypothetical protein